VICRLNKRHAAEKKSWVDVAVLSGASEECRGEKVPGSVSPIKSIEEVQ